MNAPLRVLHLEKDPDHAALVHETLESGGIVCRITRVDAEADYIAALEQGDVDLILADYTVPSIDAVTALKTARQKRPHVPFVFVSGTSGEENAVEALTLGATDYVFKARLFRLIPSVQRALREAAERAELSRAAQALQRSEAYLAQAQRLSHTGSFGWNLSSGEIHLSLEGLRIFEFEPGTAIDTERIIERTHPQDRSAVREKMEEVSRQRQAFDFEHRLQMPDGTVKHIRVVAEPSTTQSAGCEFVGAVTDVTAPKQAEKRIEQDERELRELIDFLPVPIFVLGPDGGYLHVNQALLHYTGSALSDARGEEFRTKIAHPEDVERVRSEIRRGIASGRGWELEARVRGADGQYRWFLIGYNPLRDEQGRIQRIYGTGLDIDDRKRAEERIRTENLALREEIDRVSMFEEIIGASVPLQSVLRRVAKVAPTDSTVLITGETGTGKELIARAIHKRSPRSARAFVGVNCAAIPASLIASELFGHEKGAFTGALQRRLGRFELAHGGTIFLDEIGELRGEMQIALLRVLQEHEFDRVGGNRPIRADVRVIVATNRDLSAAIEAGTFRSDLFYRLNVFPIGMPSLRERRDDIPMLVEYFIDRFARQAGKKIRRVDQATLESLQAYPWPGNIRELQNVIERSVIVCETEDFSIDESWLSKRNIETLTGPRNLSRPSAGDLREVIEAALAQARGRVSGPTGAAVKLGIPASTLESKIRLLKINKHRFRGA
jgi:PAS domain S-box-containing protein